MENSELIEYIKSSFPDEMSIIERSLINYYYLRNKKDKTESEIELMNTIYDGVNTLFRILSAHISEEFKLDKGALNRQLISIFIKT